MSKFGVLRLVNPWRGLIYVSETETKYGYLSARTKNFQQFSVYLVVEGTEFYCGRKFSREELGRWLAAELVLPDERQQIADEFGDIPAIAPYPKDWKWCSFVAGESILKPEFRPRLCDFQALAGAALRLSPDQFYPLIDPWEIWTCNLETRQPVALVMTAVSLEEADRIWYSPIWRSNWPDCPSDSEVPLRKLEDSIQETTVSLSFVSGKTEWIARVFKRNFDGSSEEWDVRQKLKLADHPIDYLPEGLLAEPFETERKRWEVLA